jgi:hypothetical protein
MCTPLCCGSNFYLLVTAQLCCFGGFFCAWCAPLSVFPPSLQAAVAPLCVASAMYTLPQVQAIEQVPVFISLFALELRRACWVHCREWRALSPHVCTLRSHVLWLSRNRPSSSDVPLELRVPVCAACFGAYSSLRRSGQGRVPGTRV